MGTCGLRCGKHGCDGPHAYSSSSTPSMSPASEGSGKVTAEGWRERKLVSSGSVAREAEWFRR